MHSWTTIVVLVVVFAFAAEFRPLDHYMTAFVTGPRVNVTVFQVNRHAPKVRNRPRSKRRTPVRTDVGSRHKYIYFFFPDCIPDTRGFTKDDSNNDGRRVAIKAIGWKMYKQIKKIVFLKNINVIWRFLHICLIYTDILKSFIVPEKYNLIFNVTRICNTYDIFPGKYSIIYNYYHKIGVLENCWNTRYLVCIL